MIFTARACDSGGRGGPRAPRAPDTPPPPPPPPPRRGSGPPPQSRGPPRPLAPRRPPPPPRRRRAPGPRQHVRVALAVPPLVVAPGHLRRHRQRRDLRREPPGHRHQHVGPDRRVRLDHVPLVGVELVR